MRSDADVVAPLPAPGGERLLVVDDDPDVLDSLGRALRLAGYSVTVASNGGDALDPVARSPVDLIVLDILMPILAGVVFGRGPQARVRAPLGRHRPARELLGYADLTLDTATRKVTRDGVPIELTRIEFSLLELLLRNAEPVLSYELILDRDWGYGEAPASNGLQVFVTLLRRKLEEAGRPRLVHNVRGVGYVLRAAARPPG